MMNRTIGPLFTRKLAPAIALCVLVLVCVLAWNNFRPFNFSRGARMTGGNPEAGRRKLAQHSCVSCHVIPGVANAQGGLAPSLASWSKQRYIAGALPNTPGNLERWIQQPSRLKADTTMPDMSVSQEDSRDMAAYLYSLN